jgi:hypothetical protein
MSKLTEAKLAENDTVAGRTALLLNAVVDDLDALAASVADPDAKAKIYALADDYEGSKPHVIAHFLVGSPGIPPAEPPKHVAIVTPTVSKEAADHTAKAVVEAHKRKRAERAAEHRGAPEPDRAAEQRTENERRRAEDVRQAEAINHRATTA